MIKIFSTDKVRELDKYTIQNEPISSIDLVERAATVFTSEFCRRYSKQTRIIVFAGQGNNGADALAIARMLTDAGYRVETYLFNPTMRLSDDCELNKQRLLHMEKIEFTEVVDDFVPPELEERDVVIDGLFGSGLNRPLTGGFAAMVRYINQSDATVVAIDIPSGLFGEDNRKNDPDAIIHADLTLTFGFPKLAFLLPENAEFVGEWKVLDILLHPEIIANTPTQFTLVTEEDIAAVFQPRRRHLTDRDADLRHLRRPVRQSLRNQKTLQKQISGRNCRIFPQRFAYQYALRTGFPFYLCRRHCQRHCNFRGNV